MNGLYRHSRTHSVKNLLDSTIPPLLEYIEHAEQEKRWNEGWQMGDDAKVPSFLLHQASTDADKLQEELSQMLCLAEDGSGQVGLSQTLNGLLKYSVNTTAPGYLDKLSSSPLPPGIAADLILSVLNTNVNVYSVSPVLTLIEKHVTRCLAELFGLSGPRIGGISVPGGSASNLTSMVVARNSYFPGTKERGNKVVDGQLAVLVSADSHYSMLQAAQVLGIGTESVFTIPVDQYGRMITDSLDQKIQELKDSGYRPFYISATAGTTVLGSFDPFDEIAEIASRHGLWFHVDGALGGGFIFSEQEQNRRKLRGIHRADSISIDPHKMLGVPLTCSFLLGTDMQKFHTCNTIKAQYLFHNDSNLATAENSNREEPAPVTHSPKSYSATMNGSSDSPTHAAWESPLNLADMTLQCSRRGDALKMFLCWQYYGTKGYAVKVDHAYNVACYFASAVAKNAYLTPVIPNTPPSCLQVCFYYTPNGSFIHDIDQWRDGDGKKNSNPNPTIERYSESQIQARTLVSRQNSLVTATISRALVQHGFMIDFAPSLVGQEEKGNFFRAVVNISTTTSTIDRLMETLIKVGKTNFPDTKADNALMI